MQKKGFLSVAKSLLDARLNVMQINKLSKKSKLPMTKMQDETNKSPQKIVAYCRFFEPTFENVGKNCD